nr:unnamed protein product [Callosobruchus analis]
MDINQKRIQRMKDHQ